MSVNRPAWSYTEGKPKSKPKPHVQSGLRFVGGSKCWCYECKSEHPYGKPCGPRGTRKLSVVPAEPEKTVVCAMCAIPMAPNPSNRTDYHYCSWLCKSRAKRSREYARARAREEKAG